MLGHPQRAKRRSAASIDRLRRRPPIRTMMLLATATALCLPSAPTPGVAASLKGKPFLLDPEYAEIGPQDATLFNFGKGFAAVFSVPKGGVAETNEIHYKTFSKSGKTDVKKTLIAKAKKGPGDIPNIYGAGGFELGGSKSLVGYIDVRYSNKKKATGGVFGQSVTGSKVTGGEREFDGSKTNRTEFGSIIALSDKRGLAYWRTVDATAGTQTAGARFIGRDGKPDGKAKAISLQENGDIHTVLPYGSGFLAVQRQIADFTFENFYAQAYDADGNKSGPEGVLSKDVEWLTTQYHAFIRLGTKKIAFLRLTPDGTGDWNLSAQIFKGTFEAAGPDTVLVKKVIPSDKFAVTALPGGDFLLAMLSGFKDGVGDGAIEFRRYNQNLKLFGKTAKTKSERYYKIEQLLTLESGEVVAMYVPSDGKLTGQIIKP